MPRRLRQPRPTGRPRRARRTATNGLHVSLLGHPQVEVDGRPLQVDTRKAIALLAVLAVDGRRSREQLAALLWPESDEVHARGALRRTLSVLGSGLGGDWLRADRQSVALAEAAAVDVHRARALEQAVAAHQHEAACADCRSSLTELAGLHRGTFLDGFVLRNAAEFDAWRMTESERWGRQLVRTLERLVELERADGDLDAALATLRRWRRFEPLNEPVHRELIRLHGQRGERQEAVNVYRECVAVLDRELGVAPLEATTRAYQDVLDGHVRSSSPAPARPRTAPEPGIVPTSTPPELPLVGRDDVLGDVMTHLDRAGTAIVVEGEAGIGKTRLVEEVEAALHRRDVDVLAAWCRPGEDGLALGPVLDLLRDALRRPGAHERVTTLPEACLAEVARLVPELGTGTGTDAAALQLRAAGRARFLEAIVTALDVAPAPTGRPVVLIVEDVHQADGGTLDVLEQVAAAADRTRLRLVMTRRTGSDVSQPHGGAPRPAHPDLVTFRLGRLDATDVRALCHEVLEDAGDGLVHRVATESGGLPLALVHYLEWLARDDIDPTSPWPLPSGLREVVEERLTGLDGATLQVASAAAVVGHGADVPLLVTVSGRSEDETVLALDRLLDLGLAVASRDGTFELAHDHVRAVAYDTCTPARRRLLHARVATALEARAGRRGGGRLAARIAEHARAAGLRHEAARWAVRAGDHAASVFANHEAMEHFETALALDPDDPAEVHARIARIHVLSGDYEAALAAFETAAALAADEATLTGIEHELGGLHVRRREWAAARLHLETALAGSQRTDPARAARIRADVALVALQAGDLDEAGEQAREALTAAETAGDRAAMAQARNVVGMVARRRGAVGDAQRHFEHAAALAGHLRDPSAYIAALNNLALTTAEADDPDRACDLLELALQRCERQGDRHRQAALLNNLADLHHRRGDVARTREHQVRAVALFSDIGERRGDLEAPDPEVWKLVEW